MHRLESVRVFPLCEDITSSFVAVADFTPNGRHQIQLEFGDKMRVSERLEGWYRGVNLSSGEKGIFPVCNVRFKETEDADPVIKELHSVLREWTLLLQAHCVV